MSSGPDSRIVRGHSYEHVVPTFAWYQCDTCGRWNEYGSHDHKGVSPRACDVTRGCSGTMVHTLSSPPRGRGGSEDDIWAAVKRRYPGASEKAASYRAWTARLLSDARASRRRQGPICLLCWR